MDIMLRGAFPSASAQTRIGTKSKAGQQTGFQETLQGVETKRRTQDSVDLSTMSYEQRLVELRKLHEQTDYSKMSDAERAKTIDDRFEEAFPKFFGMTSGLFIGNKEIERIEDERVAQYNETMQASYGDSKSMGVRFREAHYSGMSDDEVRASVNEKYKEGTILDRAGALNELTKMGLDHGIGGITLVEMHRQLRDSTGKGRLSGLDSQHPLRQAAMFDQAGSMRMNWTQIKQLTLESLSKQTHQTDGMTDEAAKNQYLQEVTQGWDDFLADMLKF